MYVEQFGTEDTQGIAYTEVEDAMRGCPAPRLVNTILRASGDYMLQDNNWKLFAKKTLYP